MKYSTILILSLFATLSACQSSTSNTEVHSPLLVPAWQTSSSLQQPESVVYDTQRDTLFVSNVNGGPNDADGNGYISQLSLNGEILEQHWLDGLNAPKGLALVGNSLYVADINELVVIDIASKKIRQRYLAPNAKFLNDVAADSKGNVYVSDMMTNTIHRLSNGQFEIWLHDDQLEAPNGLLIEGNKLLVGSWGNMTDGFSTKIAGHLKTINIDTKHIESLGNKTPAGNLDGVEADGHGNYFVTDWMVGKLLHITPAGDSITLIALDQGSADLTVLLKQDLVIIPMMLSAKVMAFQIKE
ncbi:MAG: SMP-30/gluconolactonase/LRE family protein [Gammaproteobacteria bacterium]|nr:SMP-30/gluconolactonase/LRE family protein [Gammaproteobacteria bacterium]